MKAFYVNILSTLINTLHKALTYFLDVCFSVVSLRGQFKLKATPTLVSLNLRGLIKNKTQTAVINIVSFRIFMNSTFPMLFNIHFQELS